MTDAELLREFLMRERRWYETLEALRGFHATQMGKAAARVQWMAGQENERLSWFGFYWLKEVFWFGYGLHRGVWSPLIEADNRSAFSEVWEAMRAELPGNWESVAAERGLYNRLWAPRDVVGSRDSELEWFRARSRELHEFAVQPEV